MSNMYAHTWVMYEGDTIGHCTLCGLSGDSKAAASDCPERAR